MKPSVGIIESRFRYDSKQGSNPDMKYWRKNCNNDICRIWIRTIWSVSGVLKATCTKYASCINIKTVKLDLKLMMKKSEIRMHEFDVMLQASFFDEFILSWATWATNKPEIYENEWFTVMLSKEGYRKGKTKWQKQKMKSRREF